MPVDQLTNPAASPYSGGLHTESYRYDPTKTVPLTNGMLVEMEPLVAPSVGPLLIQQSTTTFDNYGLGVVIGAPVGGYLPGSLVQVVTKGFVLGLFSNATTAGNYAAASQTTAGMLTSGTATAAAGTTMGLVLSSASAGLVPMYFNRM